VDRDQCPSAIIRAQFETDFVFRLATKVQTAGDSSFLVSKFLINAPCMQSQVTSVDSKESDRRARRLTDFERRLNFRATNFGLLPGATSKSYSNCP